MKSWLKYILYVLAGLAGTLVVTLVVLTVVMLLQSADIWTPFLLSESFQKTWFNSQTLTASIIALGGGGLALWASYLQISKEHYNRIRVSAGYVWAKLDLIDKFATRCEEKFKSSEFSNGSEKEIFIIKNNLHSMGQISIEITADILKELPPDVISNFLEIDMAITKIIKNIEGLTELQKFDLIKESVRKIRQLAHVTKQIIKPVTLIGVQDMKVTPLND